MSALLRTMLTPLLVEFLVWYEGWSRDNWLRDHEQIVEEFFAHHEGER